MTNNAKHFVRGLSIALIIPFFGISIWYLIKFTHMGYIDYLDMLERNNLVAPVISISLLPNLLLFYFFLNRERFKAGQGVIMAMLLWGLVIVYYKFLI